MSDRVIKFRAKQTNDRGWFFGAYIPPEYASYNVGTIYNGYMRVEIDEDTLGQYTGLCDSEEHEIYEGDIISFMYRSKKHVGSVYYSDGCFRVKSKTNMRDNKLFTVMLFNEIHVLGNVTDNPELLGGDTE